MSAEVCIWLSSEDQAELEGWVADRNTPQKLVWRSRIVLLSAAGNGTMSIMRAVGKSKPSVWRWQERYLAQGIDGLRRDATRPGRKPPLTAKKIAEVVEKTLREKPPAATHWSTRTMAHAVGLSHTSVKRIWNAHGLKPHLTRGFKLSNDKQFVDKVQDVVGLYLNPPDEALVLSVDEKSQIQALDRTQPILPLRPGLPERRTHDYCRHGTTSLFAALNVLLGTVIGCCMERHRHIEFLRFLEKIDRETPKRTPIHLVLDNYGTHKHPKVVEWFATHPRYHLHFTPTSCSWLNLIERWFAEITRKRIRRGTFRSVPELIRAINDYIRQNNKQPKPFIWTATPSSMLRKIKNCKEALETED